MASGSSIYAKLRVKDQVDLIRTLGHSGDR